MTYPFVPAPDHWSRRGTPIRAIVIHMAEGGGTVSHLTKPDGNSSHYVVEYTGRIVQMVRESEAAGSINPRELRTTDDKPYTYLGETITYGATAAKAALAPYWSNPNAAVIAIETEGFAKVGPNGAERASLARLVADIRSRHPGLPVLGHRDFQGYKACPGKLIPWADYGGHGPHPEEPDVLDFTILEEPGDGTVTVRGADHSAIVLADGSLVALAAGTEKRSHAKVRLAKPCGTGPGDRQTGYLVGDRGAVLLAQDVVFTAAAPLGDVQQPIELRVAGKVVYSAKV